MKAAVFVDRDGVINELILNAATGEFESPKTVAQVQLRPQAAEAICHLHQAGHLVFIVSNQPDFAKGKATLEDLQRVALEIENQIKAAGGKIRQAFYCYHHPQGVVPAYTGPCECRKPAPGNLLKAAAAHSLDLKTAWMIGDQDTDVQCGQNAHCRTILVENKNSAAKRGGAVKPDATVDSLSAAVQIILRTK
jgi:D-glycero-D-manno-heptose 1,7-bisphosphate phosphatase